MRINWSVLEFIFNRAIFIYVSTDNTEDAFRMFSILNNRGIPLTTADSFKIRKYRWVEDGERNKKICRTLGRNRRKARRTIWSIFAVY